jgi:diaminopimelate epimerase
MRIINSDGSEAEMCGNGIRCFALYAYINGICGKNAAVETLAGIKNTSVLDKKNGLVNVDMGMPSDIKVIELKLEGRKFTVYFLNTGVPHAVIFSNNPQVKVDGRKIRYHKTFKPAGTNVNFAGVTGRNSINVRTYERGVEDETDACGTGSTAAAYIANKFKNVKFPVSVKTLGGDMLRIDINKEGHLFMAGGVKYICEGILF